ncbi:Beta-hexosaminidase subunit alpha [Pelomyxa schiedti]|nr:Beta-hexosaminidase subunit alpha [Pelomyxa schiedti]
MRRRAERAVGVVVVASIAAIMGVVTCCDEGTLLILPQPQRVTCSDDGAVVVNDPQLTIQQLSGSQQLSDTAKEYIENAFSRCVEDTINIQKDVSPWVLSLHSQISDQLDNWAEGTSAISEVIVVLEGSDPFPTLDIGVNETYSIEVTDKVELHASTVWGILRGFETLAQLIEWDSDHFTIQHTPLFIEDWPRFPWRGLLIDTSRHFIPLSKLKQITTGLAAMKMNLLHIHLTDAQSFPYDLPSYPDLSGKGAFNKAAHYSHDDLLDLISFAESFGVIIMPEFDMPGHTASWGLGYDVATDCWDWLLSGGGDQDYPENAIPLNPAGDLTFDIITEVFRDSSSLFSSPYIHVGGDEVNSGCWLYSTQRQEIMDWMEKNSIETWDELYGYMILFAQNVVKGSDKIPVVWEEALDQNSVTEDAIIGTWKSSSSLKNAVATGHKAIQLYGWYQDMQAPLCTASGVCPECNTHWMWVWTYVDMYNNEPIVNMTEEEASLVLGGEAPTWGESVDVLSWDQRGLTRSPAVAERLWSAASVTDRNWFEVRTDRFRCLAVRRGISKAGPLYSEYCEMPDDEETEETYLFIAIGALSAFTVALTILTTALGYKLFKKTQTHTGSDK